MPPPTIATNGRSIIIGGLGWPSIAGFSKGVGGRAKPASSPTRLQTLHWPRLAPGDGVVALVVFVGGALAYLRERRRRTVRRPVPSQARQQRRRGLRRSIRVARGSRSGSSRSSRSSPCRCLGCRCLGSIGRSEHREQPTRAMGRGCGRCAEVKERWRREPASHLLHHTTQRQRRHSAQLHPCSWGVKQKQTPHVSTTKIASLVFQECCLPSALA